MKRRHKKRARRDDIDLHSYPIGSLIVLANQGSARKTMIANEITQIHVSLFKEPQKLPYGSYMKPSFVHVVAIDSYWTVVEKKDGWSRIVWLHEPHHSGWTYYVQDNFDLVGGPACSEPGL